MNVPDLSSLDMSKASKMECEECKNSTFKLDKVIISFSNFI